MSIDISTHLRHNLEREFFIEIRQGILYLWPKRPRPGQLEQLKALRPEETFCMWQLALSARLVLLRLYGHLFIK